MKTLGLENILIASSISDIFVSKFTFFCCTCKVSRQSGSACNSAVSKDRSTRKEITLILSRKLYHSQKRTTIQYPLLNYAKEFLIFTVVILRIVL